ncbi:MAG: hypothetical protein KJO49_11915, partial [Bacteroidia bacterium]|nr:hypothetical protein [Bacteroidia bacterium]
MAKLAFDYFIKKIRIKAPVKTVYESWCTSGGLESWFLKKAIFFRNAKELKPDELAKAGDRYTWQWHNWEPTESCE